ncbi:MAG: (d)CMP kinase [Phycisphaerales bacterium]|nr:(d)CMP kinase [Phycisphaerales bacterium]MCB9836942.1 (d)CMP kinase [Phycisphaera sp.]
MSTLTHDQKSTRSTPTGQPIECDLIVTLDGPAGTGKSTVARLLAAKLGLDFLDTGAMYRAAAAITIDKEIDLADTETILATVIEADLHFDWTQDPPTILAWLSPYNQRIRDLDVTKIVSQIAAIGRLREHMVRKQRLIGQQHPRLVTEGRDQGSVVFPDAEVKFYLDADPAVRAARRAEQIRLTGNEPPPEDELLHDILLRDSRDSTRKDGPLICPDDAEKVDTSPLTIDEVVGFLESRVRARIAHRNA